MTYPVEYQRSQDEFYKFLNEVKEIAMFRDAHMAYTVVQGVFMAFRRRISLKDAIKFSNILPAGIRAFFVADWDVDEERKDFVDRKTMIGEVGQLRPLHNFASEADDPIRDVAVALRRCIDEIKLDNLLLTFPEGSIDFWSSSH